MCVVHEHAADATVTLFLSAVRSHQEGSAPGCLLSSNFELAASLFQKPKGFVGCRHDSFLRAHRRSMQTSLASYPQPCAGKPLRLPPQHTVIRPEAS